MGFFRRIGNLIRGMLGLAVSDLELNNPEAVIEVEKENLRKQVADFNKGLASHAGMCERLMSSVKKLEKDEEEARASTSANLKANNREAAGQAALKLQTVRHELEENRGQLEKAEATYKDLIRARDNAVVEAKEKIERIRTSVNDMRMQQAMAEMNETAAGLVTEVGATGDTLNRMEEMVQDARDKAAGRSRVARDALDIEDVETREAEKEALAEQALADFAAAEGIHLDGADASDKAAPDGEESSPRKSMGPAEGPVAE